MSHDDEATAIWDVFGTDDDDVHDDDEACDANNNINDNKDDSSPNRNDRHNTTDPIETAERVDDSTIQQIKIYWMRQNSSVSFSQRVVGLCYNGENQHSHAKYPDRTQAQSPVLDINTKWEMVWKQRFIKAGMMTEMRTVPWKGNLPPEPFCDALVYGERNEPPNTSDEEYVDDTPAPTHTPDPRYLAEMVTPGGLLVLPDSIYLRIFGIITVQKPHEEWIPMDLLATKPEWIVLQRRTCSIQSNTCRWLPTHYNTSAEYDRLARATISLSILERQSRSLTEASIKTAVQAIREYGYCVVSGGIIDPTDSLAYARAALDDFHAAAQILMERDGVDLYHPGAGSREATAYRELSQREDFRVDIRHGPSLSRIRGPEGNASRVLTANDVPPNEFLRGHRDILEIIRRTMNPTDDTLAPGNVGRYNFDGRGPDGSFQNLRVGPVGAIVSSPGSADQALHADTPHLFEHLALLPAHYINVFTPGLVCNKYSNKDTGVIGQTALLHGTHRLDVTARYWNRKTDLWNLHLVRPCLQIGDALLFDCRILHFGMANESSMRIERPLLYTNATIHWFTDPKNWDNEKIIFAPENEEK